MGNNPSIERTTRPSTSVPQQTTARPHNGIFANTEAGIIISQIPSHAQQAPGSPSILTPKEISALGPKRLKRHVDVKNISFGKLRCDLERLGEDYTFKFAFTVGGIRSEPTLRKIGKMLQNILHPLKARNLTAVLTEHGAEVTFNCRSKRYDEAAYKETLEGANNLLTNLHALGLDNFLVELSNSSSVVSILTQPRWLCESYPDDTEIRDRLDCIEELVGHGHCEAAYKIFSDLSPWCKNRLVPTCLDPQQRSLFALLKQPKAQRLRGFTTGLCGACKGYRDFVQTGKIVLRELLKLENNTKRFLIGT